MTSATEDLPELRAESDSAFEVLLQPEPPRTRLVLGFVIVAGCLLFSLFHLFTASIGSTESYQTRTFVVSLTMVLGYLVYPTGRRSWREPINAWFAFDLAVIAFIIATQIHLFYATQTSGGLLISGMVELETWQIVLGGVYIALLMEMTRRCAGWPMLIIALVFLVYVLFAEYAPSAIAGPSSSPAVLVRNLFFNIDGVFGVPVGAMTDYVIIFMIFGQFLAVAGAGDFFTHAATALTGRQTGGPAKAAVVSSALMGTISGSAIGNVVTTGSVTIPLMHRFGYRPAFAGAVEAVASTGGQIMPPVMGAVAFIMAQLMGVRYVEVAIAAAVPAILYFWAAFWAVHWEAKRLGLRVMTEAEVPRLGPVLRSGWHYLLPLVLLIAMLSMDQSIIQAAFYSAVLTFALSFVRPESRITPLKLLGALESVGRQAIVVVIVAGAAGVIISVVTTSGLSWRSLALLVEASDNRLWLALILSAIVALILGMGVSTTGVYVTLAAILVPALVAMGLEPMAAHMFALYYAVVGLITPPVALAAFAAAGIAGAAPMTVAMMAARIALPIYLVPFVFAYEPALLLIGSWDEIALHVSTAFIGVWLFSCALWGYLLVPLSLPERALLVAAGVLLISASAAGAVIGVAIGGAVLAYQWRASRRRVDSASGRAP